LKLGRSSFPGFGETIDKNGTDYTDFPSHEDRPVSKQGFFVMPSKLIEEKGKK